MTTRVNLYSNLRNYTDDRSTVEVSGATVGECLSDLVRQFPKLGRKLLDPAGNISPQVFISINMNSPRPEKKDAPVKEGDELYVVLIVAGG
jgi:molybdopterin converting factor small subunit